MGDGINDSIALKKANVSISLRGASSIATDTAHIVFLEEGLAKLCELRDIARDLDHNVKRSWSMILAPNIACIAGVFTMGFGIMASVVTNNVAALAALANGVLPLRKVAQIEAERRHRLEMTQAYAMERNAVHSPAAPADRRADARGDQPASTRGVGMRSRCRPSCNGTPILPWHRRSSYEPDAPARGVPQSPRWRVGLVCARMRNFLAGVIAPILGLNHPDSVNHLVRRVDRALARSSELREDIGMTQRILEQRRHGSS